MEYTMKKMLAILAAIAVAAALFGISAFADGQVLTRSDDGLTVTVDFTALADTAKAKGAVKAEDIGAIDIDDNYQIAQNDGTNVLFTIDGFNPAWIIYKVSAPAGKSLDTLKLTITGRICDFGPNSNAFAVFAKPEAFSGSGSECELNQIAAQERTADQWESYAIYVQQANLGTMATWDSVETVHEFDLTEAAKGNTEMYVAIYQLTTGSPEWIEYRGLKLEATASETTPVSNDVLVHGGSFDSLRINGEINFGEGDGDASKKLDNHGRKVDGTAGNITELVLRGWIGFENHGITALGYQIDGNDPVFNDSFLIQRQDIDAIRQAANGGPNAEAFEISVDVSGLKDSHTIVAVAKLADGTVAKICGETRAIEGASVPDTSFTFEGPATQNVATGDSAVLFAAIVCLSLAAVLLAGKKSFLTF